MSTTVVGAGAVGGLIAGILHREGHDVSVFPTPETGAAIRANGLRVSSDQFGDWVCRIDVLDRLPQKGTVLLAVKAPSMHQVIPELVASAPARVFALQNGLEHPDRLRQVLPHTSVIAASIFIGASRLGRHEVRHDTDFAKILVPEASRGIPLVEALAKAGVTVETAPDENAVLWTKFAFLAPMALLTAYWGLPLGAARDRDSALTRSLAVEVSRIAESAGFAANPQRVLASLYHMPAHMRSSLERDIRAGSPNELDAIGGACIRLAMAAGVRVPHIEVIVHSLEQATGRP